MTIPIVSEPEDPFFGIKENCCFCRKPTDYWTNLPRRKPGDQVACCEECSGKYRHRDVPTKVYWCQKEDQIREQLRFGPRP